MKQWKAMFLQVHSAREPAAAAFEIEEVAHQLEIEKRWNKYYQLL